VSSVAARPRTRPLPHAGPRAAEPRTRARPTALVLGVAAVLVLVAASTVLRTRAMDAGFWIDEGISIGVASYPFLDIPEVLRIDGSPPLYYLLLHVWMQAFGTSEVAVHAMSLVFSLLAIPTALWAARGVFGPRVGWIAALLAALNPFLTHYAQETRMYSLAALLSFVVAAAFVRAFVGRERRYIVVFALALTAMFYTHNWAFFLAAGTVAALALLWRWAAPEERRGLVRDGVLAYGLLALLYLPWVPTLVHQVLHTGAPWAERPSVQELLMGLGFVLGGTTAAIALLLVGGNALTALVRDRRDRRIVALLLMAGTAVLLAWLTSLASPAFALRYFASFVGPMILLAAAGLASAGRLGLICLVVVGAFWLDPRTSDINAKSNVRSVATSIAPLVTAGDLIVSTHPEQLPVLSYYMPDGVRYANALGPVEDPRVFDWTDADERLRETYPTPTIDRLLRTLRPGQELVLVQPILRTYEWNAPWTELVRRRSLQWERRLQADPRVRREAVVPVFGYDRPPRGVRAIVYRVRDRG
jgi:mannosyltransferase